MAPTKISASTAFAVSAVQHSIAIILGPTWAYVADRVGGAYVRMWCAACSGQPHQMVERVERVTVLILHARTPTPTNTHPFLL